MGPTTQREAVMVVVPAAQAREKQAAAHDGGSAAVMVGQKSAQQVLLQRQLVRILQHYARWESPNNPRWLRFQPVPAHLPAHLPARLLAHSARASPRLSARTADQCVPTDPRQFRTNATNRTGTTMTGRAFRTATNRSNKRACARLVGSKARQRPTGQSTSRY
jgi:hypothetical protein